jgi:hydroxyethylthiazole kinase-like uncharacterized protein yjeF
MRNVVTPAEMARIEILAYADGADERDFMEVAGRGIAEAIDDPVVCILGGKGNNAGDAYVAGRYLLQRGCDVSAIQIPDIETCSALCQENYIKFIECGGTVVDAFPPLGTLLDGLFGTGFQGEAGGEYGKLIDRANSSGLPIIAIDIPSGLNGETGEASVSIRATKTLYLELPKLGFFLREGPEVTGSLSRVSFGLGSQYISQAESKAQLLEQADVGSLIPEQKKTQHKYQAGHVVALAGSPGMPGAAMLTCLAALRTGAGMVHLLHPIGMEAELATAPYELVRIPYDPSDADFVVENLNRGGAALIGPGLGIDFSLVDILPWLIVPVVIDADGLNALAKLDLSPPPGAVLTPHLGEMRRLLGVQDAVTPTFLGLCQEYAERTQCVVVLKGMPTFIFSPGSVPTLSVQGDPGMATAGSGDVLTGVVATLLAQGLVPKDAAYLGVYLHGVAGEIAALGGHSRGLIASDLIDRLSEAFDKLL